DAHLVVAQPRLHSAFGKLPAAAVSRRAGGRRISPRQASDRKRDARPEIGQLLGLRTRDLRELAALDNIDAVGAFREHTLPSAKRPPLVARIARKLLRPAGHDVVRAKDILTALFGRDRGHTSGRRLRCYRGDGCKSYESCQSTHNASQKVESRK